MCKKIKPYFKELGKVFSKVDSVEIVKMDATENDVYHPVRAICMSILETNFAIRTSTSRVIQQTIGLRATSTPNSL
jgi:hypothetical protein